MKQRFSQFLVEPGSIKSADATQTAEADAFQVYKEGTFDPKDEVSPEMKFGRQIREWLTLDQAEWVMEAILQAFESRLYVGSASEALGSVLAEVMPGILRCGLNSLNGAKRCVWDIHVLEQSMLLGETNEVPRDKWLSAVRQHQELSKLRSRLDYETSLFVQTFCLTMMSIARWLDAADASVVCMSTLPVLSEFPPVAQLRAMRILARMIGFSIRLMHQNRAPLVVSNLMAFVSTLQRLSPKGSEDGQIVMVFLDLQLQTITAFCRGLGSNTIMTRQETDVHNITQNTVYSALVATLAPFASVLRMLQKDERDDSSSSSSSLSVIAEDSDIMDERTAASSIDSLPDHHVDPEVKRFKENPLAGIDESLRFCNPSLCTDMEQIPSIDRASFLSAFEYCLDLFCITQPMANLLELSNSLTLIVESQTSVSVLEPTPLAIARAIAVCLCYWRYRNPQCCSPISHVTSASTIFISLMRTSYLCLKHAFVESKDEDRAGLICCALTFSRYASQYIADIDMKFLETVHGLTIPLGPWMALQMAAAAAGQLLMGLRNATLKLVYARTIALVERFPRDVGGRICENALTFTLTELGDELREIPAALWIREIRSLYPIYTPSVPITCLKKFVTNLLQNPDILAPWASAIQEIALTMKLWSIPVPSPSVSDLIKDLDQLRGSLRREMTIQPHQSLALADFAIEDLI